MEWSRSKTLEFIASYKSQAILWDCKHENYKDRIKRHEALEVLAAEFGTMTTEIERKIKNLQSHFLRERKRMAISKKHTSTWFAFKPLSFLLTRNKEEPFYRTKPATITTSKATPEAIIIQPKSQVFTKPTTSLVHETVSETFSPMKEILKWFKDRDEFDLYGDQVAIKLRNIASPFARVTVQNRINTLLMEAELGMYDTENQFASTNMDHYYTETKVLIDESQPS